MSGTKGLFARGFNNDGTEGLFARGFIVYTPPEQFTAQLRSDPNFGVEFDVYKTAGTGTQFTITKAQV